MIARSNRCRPATVSGLQGSDASTPRKSQKVCRCIPIQSPIGWLNHVKPLFCNTYIFIYIYNHRHIHIYIHIYIYIYITTWEPKSQFFSIVRGWHVFSVIAGLLVRLKARSGEPKYGLLTRVKSKKTFGFLLGVYQYFLFFPGELSGWVRLWANFGPKSVKLTRFFFQMLLIFSQDETGTYRLLTIFFSHYRKKHAKLEFRL